MSEPAPRPRAANSRRDVIARLRAPTLLYGAFQLGTLGVAVTGRTPALLALACWTTGLVAWTFFEYAFHRWVQHDPRVVRRIRRWDDHFRHHAVPEDLDEFVFTVGQSAPIGAVVTAIAVAVAPSAVLGLCWASGFIGAYLVNEWVHAASHSPELRRGLPWLERWSAHHARHHWERGDAFYGFITPFWDRLLGTCPPPKHASSGRKPPGEER